MSSIADILTILLRQDSSRRHNLFTLGITPKLHACSMREYDDQYESLVYYYDRALANVSVGPQAIRVRKGGRMAETRDLEGSLSFFLASCIVPRVIYLPACAVW